MAAEHRVSDEKHEEHKTNSGGAEKLCRRQEVAFRRADRGRTFRRKNTHRHLVVVSRPTWL